MSLPDASDLTPRQSEILHFIQRFIEETGMPPTRAEMARELGFRSANAAEEHLRALQRKGVIELLPGTSRGIRLAEAGRYSLNRLAAEEEGLPLVGRVAAGQPILAASTSKPAIGSTWRCLIRVRITCCACKA